MLRQHVWVYGRDGRERECPTAVVQRDHPVYTCDQPVPEISRGGTDERGRARDARDERGLGLADGNVARSVGL